MSETAPDLRAAVPAEWKPDLSLQLVVCAANRHHDSGRIICGARHWDSIMRGQLIDGQKGGSWDQGFIDQWGQFLTREEAWKVAVAKGQIRRQIDTPEGTLYSEHLY